MYAFALTAALSAASPALGQDAPAIDITRLAAAAGGQDWNGDGLPDRLLLVWSDRGDAFDALTFMSDAATGTLLFAGASSAVLPARWPLDGSALHGVRYGALPDCSKNCIADYTKPHIYSTADGTIVEITVDWTASGWAIAKVHTRVDGFACVIDYRAGTAEIGWLEDGQYTIDPGPAPALSPYWWREGLPKECSLTPRP